MLRRFALALIGLLSICGGARADSIHLSHYGEVMPTVPWAIALAQHLFQKNGVNVTDVISSQGGGTTIRNMLAGGLGFGEVSAGATVTGITAGLPVKIIGVGVDSADDNSWVVPKQSPYHSFRDLRGRNLGVTAPGGVTYVYAELLLKKNGMTLHDVNAVPVGTGAGIAALDAGTIDATYEYEPLFSRDESKYRVIANIGEVFPRIATLFLVATQDMIDQHPGPLRAIMLTHKQAVDFIYAHPKEAADLATSYMVGADQAVLERAVARLVRFHFWSEGGFNNAALANLQQVLNLTGEAKGKIDFKAMTDNRFLPTGVAPLQ
jgi:NitT/TauT family transport system substrate-binding protein